MTQNPVAQTLVWDDGDPPFPAPAPAQGKHLPHSGDAGWRVFFFGLATQRWEMTDKPGKSQWEGARWVLLHKTKTQGNKKRYKRALDEMSGQLWH